MSPDGVLWTFMTLTLLALWGYNKIKKRRQKTK